MKTLAELMNQFLVRMDGMGEAHLYRTPQTINAFMAGAAAMAELFASGNGLKVNRGSEQTPERFVDGHMYRYIFRVNWVIRDFKGYVDVAADGPEQASAFARYLIRTTSSEIIL